MSDWDVASEAAAPQPAPVVDPTTGPTPAPSIPAAAQTAAAPTDEWSVAAEEPAPVKKDKQTALGGANAAATGFNSGVLDVVGAPVDTARNIKEMAKAGAGVVSKLTTGTIPDWLQPEDPDKYKYDVGSSQWLKQQVSNLGAGNLVNSVQKTKLNQYLNAGGEGAGATLASGGNLPAAAAGALGGAVSQQVADSGAPDSVAAMTGILTGAAVHHLTSPGAPAKAPGTAVSTSGVPNAEDMLNDFWDYWNVQVDPAERILKTPSLPGPTPAEAEGSSKKAAPAAPETAPVAVGKPTPGSAAVPTETDAEVQQATKAQDFSASAVPPDHYVITADGKASPLVGADAADTVAAPGTVIVQKGDGAKKVTIVSKGADLDDKAAQGALDRAVEAGELTSEKGQAPSTTPDGGVEVNEAPLPQSAPEPYIHPNDTHPMRNGVPYVMVSAERQDAPPQENARNTQILGQYLQAAGLRSAPTQGQYLGVPEHSYAVSTPTPQAADFVNKVAQQFKQDSVMHVDANQNATLHYGDGRQEWLGAMKQVPASEASTYAGWTRDENGNFYTVKPPEAAAPTGVRAGPSKSIFADPAKVGGVAEVGEPEQARRASTFKRIGLDEVRQSALTGNAKEAASDFQTSKLDHPVGQRMTALQESERNALIQHADNLVSDSGGTKGLAQPDMEARGRTQAAPIDGYDQHLEKATQRIYDIAKTVAAGKPIQTDGLANFLTKKKSEFLGTVEGKQLMEGVLSRMNELGLVGDDNETFHPATVEQAERLRQYIGQQWQPKLTQLISMLKNNLDNDVAASAGRDIFKQAREIRALRSKILEEPEAVSKLLQPKEANRLGINRNVPFTEVPRYLAELEPDQFGHYIDVLKQAATASPELWSKSLAALREVRAQYANEILAAGNKTAGAWNQKAVNQYLKDHELNMRKVFTSEELGKYQDLDNAGRWLHQDKSYPGAEAQKQNFITNGILKGGGLAAEGAGAAMGHIPGWLAGRAIHGAANFVADKALGRTIEGRIIDLNGRKAPKSEITTGMHGDGPRPLSGASPKERGGPKAAGNLLFRHFSNLDDYKVTLDPNKYGTGLKGREATRVAGGAPKSISLYSIDHPDNQVEHELRGRTEYRVSVPRSKLYDLSADPKGIIDKVMARNDGVYDHTQVEKAVKTAGYLGYHLPNGDGIFKGQARLFQPTQAVRVDQLGPSQPRRPLSLSLPRQRGGPKFEAPSAITKYLTEPEKAQLRTDTAMRMVEAFHELPPTHELAAAALAGQAKRGWYDDSAKAITNVFGPDAPRFTALLAAMSPQTSVQMNFHNALRTFVGWDKAGRPTDPGEIKSIMEQNSLKSPVAKAEGKSNVLGAWVNNSVRALTDPDPENLTLSGPKVDSFMKNLQGHVNAVTLDAWMASFAHIDQNRFAGGLTKTGPGKSPTYLGYSAKVREAAAMLTRKTGEKWTPAEVQETVWSWAKTAYEHADEFGGMATIPELVKNGEITDELIKSTPAFHTLFQEAGHSNVLRDSRFSGGLERLHEGTGSDPGSSSPSQKADAASRSLRTHLYKAAERLEGVRQERSAARGKSASPLLGDDDTEF